MIATALIALLAALPSSGYQLLTVTNPSSALTDFTLVVDLSNMSASWWSAVDTSDGTKGRAAIHSSGTELACDWIDFDDTGETGLLRVLWDGSLATSGTQQLRVYPPMSGNASVAADGTYGSDNAYDEYWEGYWPCEDASGGLSDRTANGLDLTSVTGTPAYEVTGKLGNCIQLDGTEYFSGAATVTAHPFTILAWGWKTNATATQTIVGVGDADIGSIRSSLNFRDNEYIDAQSQYGGLYPYASSAARYSAETWTHAAGVYASSASRIAYINAGNSGSNSTDVTFENYDQTVVGARAGNSTLVPWIGNVDDVSIHSTNRAAAWIALEYAQTNDNSSFYTASSWVAGGSAVPVFFNHYQRRR